MPFLSEHLPAYGVEPATGSRIQRGSGIPRLSGCAYDCTQPPGTDLFAANWYAGSAPPPLKIGIKGTTSLVPINSRGVKKPSVVEGAVGAGSEFELLLPANAWNGLAQSNYGLIISRILGFRWPQNYVASQTLN